MLIKNICKVFFAFLFFLFFSIFTIDYLIANSFNPNWSESSFDKKIWDASAHMEIDSPRALMASDLKLILENGKFSKQEVMDLLGKPYQSYEDAISKPDILKYDLGDVCYGTSACSLKIKFNTLEQVEIVTFN